MHADGKPTSRMSKEGKSVAIEELEYYPMPRGRERHAACSRQVHEQQRSCYDTKWESWLDLWGT